MNLWLRRNVAFSVLEAVVTGGSLFIVYKLMIVHLALEEIGIWSLVAAATSMARLGDLGVAVGVTRYVAKAIAEDNGSYASATVETALISVAGLYTVLSIVAYLPLNWALQFFLSGPQLSQGRQLLPLALTSFVLVNINGVILSTLAGLQQSYVKSIIVSFGFLILIIGAAVFIPLYQIRGILAAQICQALVIIIIAWTVLRTSMPTLTWFPLQWRFKVVRELVSYGSQIQLVSLLVFFYEPITKMIMSSFGGLSALALFELANRLVSQTRALIVSANQALVPAYTNLSIRNSISLFNLFDRNVRYTAMSVAICVVFFIFAIPATSIILIGRLDRTFILFSSVLAIGWLINTLTTPIYFLALGLGKPKYNTIAHFITAIGCVPAAIILGHYFGAIGVVFGAMASLMLETLAIFLSYIFVFKRMRLGHP